MMMSVSVPVTNPRLGEEEHAVGDDDRIGAEDRDLREDRVGGFPRHGFYNGGAYEARSDRIQADVGLGNVQRDLLRDRAGRASLVDENAAGPPLTFPTRPAADKILTIQPVPFFFISASQPPSGVPRMLTLRMRIVSSGSMSHTSRVWPVLIRVSTLPDASAAFGTQSTQSLSVTMLCLSPTTALDPAASFDLCDRLSNSA